MKPSIALTHAIQETGPHTEDEPSEGMEDGAVLTGWVLVAEWLSVDGSSWISRLDGDAAGEPLTSWRREGLLHNALFDPTWHRDAEEA